MAPAYRKAIPLLEKDGASALPIMLSAIISSGVLRCERKNNWALRYGFSWLELNDDVRGFYLQSEGKPDLEVYPGFY